MAGITDEVCAIVDIPDSPTAEDRAQQVLKGKVYDPIACQKINCSKASTMNHLLK